MKTLTDYQANEAGFLKEFFKVNIEPEELANFTHSKIFGHIVVSKKLFYEYAISKALCSHRKTIRVSVTDLGNAVINLVSDINQFSDELYEWDADQSIVSVTFFNGSKVVLNERK